MAKCIINEWWRALQAERSIYLDVTGLAKLQVYTKMLRNEGSELSEKIGQLRLSAEDGKMRLTDRRYTQALKMQLTTFKEQ